MKMKTIVGEVAMKSKVTVIGVVLMGFVVEKPILEMVVMVKLVVSMITNVGSTQVGDTLL